MIGIAVIGVGIAALARPTKLLGMALPLLQLTLYLTAVIGLVFRRGSKRAYWIGFALFGWAYFLLGLVLTWGNNNPFHMNPPFPNILGEPLAILIEIFTIPGLDNPAKMGDVLAAMADLVKEVDDSSRFLVPCSALGLVFAMLGGLIARAFYFSEAASARTGDASSTVA